MRSLITRLVVLVTLVIASTTLLLAATLASDCSNYAPGDIAVLTGTGFQSGELIDLSITIDDPVSGLHIADYDWTVEQADADGGFITTYTIPPEAADMTLTATAIGYASGLAASVSFVDAAPYKVFFTTSGLPAGVSVSVDYEGTNNGGNHIDGPTIFTTPAVSSPINALASTQLTFRFPATLTVGSVNYALVSTSHTSPITTGASGGETTITARYDLADNIPPTTTATLAGTAGNNGWYVSDVTVTLSAVDNMRGSGVKSTEYSLDNGITWTAYTAPFTISTEGVTTVKYRSTDNNNNTETPKSKAIKIDKTAPEISGAVTTDPNAAGWYKTDVTVHFDASDATSGLDTVTEDTTLTTEAADQSVTGMATDMAGNSASFTVEGINIDKTAPKITGAATTEPNANGWYKTDVTIHFTGTDDGSGIESVTPDVTLTEEGADQSVTGTVVDKAGNSNSFTVTGINIDKTAPTIKGTRTPDPNEYGWNNTDVTVKFSATDSLSGIESVTPDTTLSDEGAGQSVTGTAIDLAGNEASATVEDINIDKTAPSISGKATTDPNANGWYKMSVTVHFTASDALSGLVADPDDVTLTGEGANQSASRTVIDKAGNSASATVDGINIDKTAPKISGAATTEPNANGWYKTDVTVHFTASDSLSGVESVTADQTLTSEGADQSVTGKATDLAGNEASTTVTGINIDKTAPTINGKATTDPNAAGWYKTDVTVHFTASDSLSGIDTLTPDTTLTTEGADQSVTGTAVDKAGNSASTTVSGINIDKTAPVISINVPAASYLLNASALADWTATDALSGIKSATGTKACGECIDTATPGSKTFTVSAEDKAGNTASKTATYTVLYAVSDDFFLPPINREGNSLFKLNSTVPVKFQLRDANGAFVSTAVAKIYLSKISNGILGTEIEAVSTSAATTGNLFRYDFTANQYIFNLGTKGLSTGTWQIRVLLDDGTSKSINISLK